MRKIKLMMKKCCMKVVGVAAVAAFAALPMMAADCVPLNLGGVWHVTGKGIDAKVSLPGTLADARIGEEQDYGKWSRVEGIQARQALRLNWQFVGKATYVRDVEIPAYMAGKELELVMERVMWVTTLRVDGKVRGSCDSLGTPHVYRFAPGELSPGRHKVEIDVDNSRQYDFSGWSHGWGPTTQSIWNGIIGRFELREVNPLRSAKVFARWPANGAFEIRLPPGAKLDKVEVDGLAVTGFVRKGDIVKVSFAGEPDYWSEFHPRLYDVKMSGGGQSFCRRFGFRTVSAKGHSLYMNGKPFWFRGNIDNCQFPLTGYPAVTKSEWLRQIRIQQMNGCNGMRTHTWTPPEAAFEAADELGFYILLETGYWSDGNNMNRAVGRGNKALDEFCHRELRRLQDAYGDHASLVGLGLGNELGACDFNVLDRWMREAKAYDNRYLTLASTARQVCPSDDYMTTHSYPGVGDVRCRRAPHTDWDYEDVYSKTAIPTLAHEIGQWPVYPLWNEIGKFSGLLRAYDWMEMRDRSVSNGTFRFQREWHRASMKSNRLMYKDEVESFMRTPSCAGLQLLDVRDYTGQGEAWVGWLDAFFESKAGNSELYAFSDVFRPVATLARFGKYVWKVGETFTARLQIRNMTESAIPSGTTFPVSFGGESGWVKLARAVAPGELGDVGEVSYVIRPWMSKMRQEFTFGENRWPVFVMDAPDDPEPVPDGVVFTDDPAVMAKTLADGGRVVYTGLSAATGKGRFVPVYWSSVFFGEDASRALMLGTWFDVDHAVFGGFPTEDWQDWQWRDMTDDAVVHVLTGLVPENLVPMAMPVSDIHKSELLATMFEFRVGSGRALVCGYPIVKGDSVEARQLRRSVFRYVASPTFAPTAELSPSEFAALFAKPGETEAALKERYLTPFSL